MNRPLIVVESPAKVKTIRKYLGKNYNIATTVGHIKDLPQKEIGIDIEKGFVPKYVELSGKRKAIAALKKAAGSATDIYLASDPDREGEAIAFHAAEILKKKGRKFHRVLLYELTKNVVNEALASPGNLQQNRYKAQQARRILDRLVGYQISPILWRKVKGGLSAGRVQSVALRIICEREQAIQAFEPEEYWSITAHLEGELPPPFTAKLAKKSGKKIKIPNQKASLDILNELSGTRLVVEKVLEKIVKRNPSPPFITSRLQQEAIGKLRFSAKKTMVVAQQLYEGIDLEHGESVGLITYMRTDSVRIASIAAEEALELIRKDFGEKYALAKPRFFKNRKKAQDAHEAIRPASVFNTPEKVAPYLSKDQLSLYRLIWQRFVASQMKPALINRISVSIAAGPYLFAASGSFIKFPGFMTLYTSVEDKIEDEGEKKKGDLPELSEGMALKLDKFEPKQHFTAPPSRFTEASLVKELEENGIGRPSTYASILSIIREKGYVDLVKGYFRPSEMGFIINGLLVKSFPDIFNVDFTAKMENNLDRIEMAEVDYVEILTGFYDPFKKELNAASKSMLSMRGVGFATDIVCPECNTAQLHIKVGKNGEYLGCNRYPECTYTRNYTRNEKGEIRPVEPSYDKTSDKVCEKCARPMVVKQGRYGAFLGCSGYPDCKSTQPVTSGSSGQTTGVKCPEKDCGGDFVQRRSKRGGIFYGCNRFPDCTFAVWNRPVAEECPACGAKFLVEKSTKKDGDFLSCLTEGCGFRKQG